MIRVEAVVRPEEETLPKPPPRPPPHKSLLSPAALVVAVTSVITLIRAAVLAEEAVQKRRAEGYVRVNEMPKAKRATSSVAARRNPGLRHSHRLPSRSGLSTAVVSDRQGHGRGTPSGGRMAQLPQTQEPSVDWPALSSGRTMET
ncbi:hypothetical protein [Streptomyces sp. NPDC097610]|uniref:hypothetical protein n=1 Tax=Streptomyces sp. NPDC097610 TaxID=3157227 RepID=UPI003331BA61